MKILIKNLFVCVVLNTLSWVILTPLWQNPDEQAHFSQIQDYAEIGYIPKVNNTSNEIDLSEQIMGTKRDNFGNNKFTYHPEYNIKYSNNYFGYFENVIRNLPESERTNFVKSEATQNPPLYYWLGAIVYKVFRQFDLFTRVFAIRIYSSILFILTLLITFNISKILFKKNKALQVSLTSLVAFAPMLNHASFGVLPDPLTNLLMSSVIYLSLLIINNRVTLKIILALIATIFLGFLTRQHFLISIIILVFPSFFYLKNHKKNILNIIFIILVLYFLLYLGSYSIPVLVFIRHLSIPEIGIPNITLLFKSNFKDFSLWTINHTYHEVLPWYWGVYRWLSLSVPHLAYRLINIITVFSIIGLLYKLAISIKQRTILNKNANILFLIYASLVYFFAIFIWDYFFYIHANFSFGIQGRYYFPLIIAHFGLLLIGYWQITKALFNKYAKYCVLVLTIGIIVFNDFTLAYVANSYYQLFNISQFIVEVSQYKPLFLKGNIILVILISSLATQIIFAFKLTKYIINETNEGD